MHWTLIFTQMRKLLLIGRQNTPRKIPFAREVFWKGKENENWENPFSGSHLFNARLSSLRVICIFPNAKPQSIKCTSPSDPRSNLRDSKKARLSQSKHSILKAEDLCHLCEVQFDSSIIGVGSFIFQTKIWIKEEVLAFWFWSSNCKKCW